MAWFGKRRADGTVVAIDLLVQCLDDAAEHVRHFAAVVHFRKLDDGDFRREVFQFTFFATFCGLLSGLPDQRARDDTIPPFLFYRDILLGGRKHPEAERVLMGRMYQADKSDTSGRLGLRRHQFQDMRREYLDTLYAGYMDAYQSGGGDIARSFRAVATQFLTHTSRLPNDAVLNLEISHIFGSHVSKISERAAAYHWS